MTSSEFVMASTVEYVGKLHLKDVAWLTKLSRPHPYCCSLIKSQFFAIFAIATLVEYGVVAGNVLHFRTDDDSYVERKLVVG